MEGVELHVFSVYAGTSARSSWTGFQPRFQGIWKALALTASSGELPEAFPTKCCCCAALSVLLLLLLCVCVGGGRSTDESHSGSVRTGLNRTRSRSGTGSSTIWNANWE